MAEAQQHGTGEAIPRLEVSVGEPAQPHGRTRVELDVLGALVIAHAGAAGEPRAQALGGAEEEIIARADLGEDVAGDLMSRAEGFEWERPFPARPGIPDEAVVRWSYDDGRGGRRELRAWLGEVEDDPRMGPVLDRLRQAVREAAQDRVVL